MSDSDSDVLPAPSLSSLVASWLPPASDDEEDDTMHMHVPRVGAAARVGLGAVKEQKEVQ